MTEYVSSTAAAKMMRATLKKAFPGVKFTVRKDGSSINVGWTDGPTDAMVSAVTAAFEGEGFDGMIDMRYSKISYLLKDGTVVEGRSAGTTGSMGVREGYTNEMPEGAEEIRFLTSFVFTNRKFSDRLIAGALTSYRAKWGNEAADRVKVRADDGYGASFSCPDFQEERILREILNRRMIAA